MAKRTMCCLLAVLLLFAVVPFSVSAEPETPDADVSGDVATDGGQAGSAEPEAAETPEYTEYYARYADAERPEERMEVGLSALVAGGEAPNFFEDAEKGQVLNMAANGSNATFRFTVATAGLYNLQVLYKQHGEDLVSDALMDVAVDGVIPSYSMDDVQIPRYWTISEKAYDSRGNELSNEMAEVAAWRWQTAYDAGGRHNDPLCFWLEAGEHTVTLTFEKAGLLLAGVAFFNEKEAPAYQKPDGVKVTDAAPIIAEGEAYTWSTDSAIQLTTDSNNAAMSPSHPELRLFNAIGGSTWATTQQALGWEVEVKTSGWYKIAVKVRQSTKTGSFSTRALRIDGKLPYAECGEIRFPYSTNWYNKVIATEAGEPMLFWLEAGKHTISLEAVPGKLSNTMVELQDCVEELNRIMRQLVQVVGNSGDKYRDYNLDEEIPTLPDDVKAMLERLTVQRDEIKRLSGDNGSETSKLQTMITQLEYFVEDIDEMALKLNTFKNNITTLASWVNELLTQPLEIDYVITYGADNDLPDVSAGFFKDLWFTIQRLTVTFASDYGQLGDVDTSKEYLKVWISTGQEQMQIVQSLANEYSAMEGVKVGVKVELVAANLLEAVMAGKGPDISLQQANDLPVNLAARGELVDLSQFDGFEETRERYHANSFAPYLYNGGVYAMPLTEAFYMMFVRTDVFEEMSLEVPNTWEELYEVATILQRNNLGAGIPSDMSIFASMLAQNGGTFYNEDQTATTFGNQAEIDAFKAWTSLYTEKGFDLAYDPFNRLRTGEMPIALASFGLYNQLKVSAPEINGRWQMYPVVGTPKYNADGTPMLDENGQQVIDRSWSCATQGSVGLSQGATCTFILKGCKNKEAAWDFLKWYTSDEVRKEFALKIEMRMGVASRYTPANYRVLENLPWTDTEREMLLAQWDELVLFPEIPGSYYVGRNLTYAFRQVVYNDENPVYALNKYNEIINRELTRKLQTVN
ncbi:MAG: extracellular solute-binding protein [Clostridia bacterium]|nr:extracellular solute-binding protein [Clostridia bacterium]